MATRFFEETVCNSSVGELEERDTTVAVIQDNGCLQLLLQWKDDNGKSMEKGVGFSLSEAKAFQAAVEEVILRVS